MSGPDRPSRPPRVSPSDGRARDLPRALARGWVRLRQGGALRVGYAELRDHGPQVALVIGCVLIVLGVAGFLGVLDAVRERDDLAELDQPVLTGLAAGRSAVLTTVLTVVTTVTGPSVLPFLVLAGCLAWGVRARRWWQAVLLAAAMIVSTVVSVTLKAAVARPRPPVDTMSIPGLETSGSFPSGHTIGTATLLLVVAYLVWIDRPRVRPLVAWLLVVAAGVLLVALSRLYLGYHFVTDVVASMALAIAVLGAVVVVDRRRAVRAARATARDARA